MPHPAFCIPLCRVYAAPPRLYKNQYAVLCFTALLCGYPCQRTPPISGVQGPQEGTSRLDFEERAAYHRARYGGSDSADSRAAAQGLAPAPSGRPEPLDRHLRRELGGDAQAVDAHPGPFRDDRLGNALWENQVKQFVMLPTEALADPLWTADTCPAV